MIYYAEFLNLPHRTDRLAHIISQIDRVGIIAQRHEAQYPSDFDANDPKLQVMFRRTPGAVPCHYGQVAIMETALKKNMNALVLEDDCVFCRDFNERMVIVDEFLNSHDWDVFWLGGTYHNAPIWHGAGHPNRDIRGHCDCALNMDWEETDNPKIRRTYGIWSTYAYIVNIDSLPKVLDLLEKNVHKSMGIDWLFITLEPELYTYCFNPGMVKQKDMSSDIGKGVTEFSRFKSLGEHWYRDLM